MVDWEVTATTIFCDSVQDEVTIIVSEDGSVKCSGRQKYDTPSKDTIKTLKTKSKATGKQLSCVGINCVTVKQYLGKLLGEK